MREKNRRGLQKKPDWAHKGNRTLEHLTDRSLSSIKSSLTFGWDGKIGGVQIKAEKLSETNTKSIKIFYYMHRNNWSTLLVKMSLNKNITCVKCSLTVSNVGG